MLRGVIKTPSPARAHIFQQSLQLTSEALVAAIRPPTPVISSCRIGGFEPGNAFRHSKASSTTKRREDIVSVDWSWKNFFMAFRSLCWWRRRTLEGGRRREMKG